MKTKLFSTKSLLISLKGIGSNILVGLSAIPLWALMTFFMMQQMFVVSIIFGLLAFVWYVFFWGWLGQKLWGWK